MKTLLGLEIPEEPGDFLQGGETAVSQDWAETYYTSWGPDRDGDVATHGDNIESFRDFGAELHRELKAELVKRIGNSGFNTKLMRYMLEEAEEILDECVAAYAKACDKLDAYHEKAGTLDEIVC